MAHAITELTRSVAGSADYPNGDIADNPDGTLVNRMMLTDLLQTFQKLMIDAGITPNGLDDNTTNGYQYIQALQKVIAGGAWQTTGIVFNTISLALWANVGAPNYNASYTVTDNIIRLAGVITGNIVPATNMTVLTLPVGVRPASEVQIPGVYVKTGGTIVSTRIYVKANGEVGISSSETDTGVLLLLDGITFRKS